MFSFGTLDAALAKNKELSTAVAAAAKTLSAEKRTQKVLSFPCGANIITLLCAADLITDENQQLEANLIYILQIFSARQSREVNEFQQLVNFMQKMQSHKLLTAQVCMVIFGEVSFEKKLGLLDQVLDNLQPLTAARLVTVMSEPLTMIRLFAACNRYAERNQYFSYVVDHADPAQYQDLLACFTGNGHHWLTPELLLTVLNDSACVTTTLTAYTSISSVDMLGQFHSHIMATPHFAPGVRILSRANCLSKENVTKVLSHEYFSAAIAVLEKFAVFSLAGGGDGATILPRITSEHITRLLIDEMKLCELIVEFEKVAGELHNTINVNFMDECGEDLKLVLFGQIAALTELLDQAMKSEEMERSVQLVEYLKMHAGCRNGLTKLRM